MENNWLTIENRGQEVVLVECSDEAEGNIVIPDGVTQIGDEAFRSKHVSSIKIPGSVKSIGKSAFPSRLTSIVVASNNPIFDSRDDCNAIIETATNTLIVGCINTKIPNSVTSIGERAFSSCLYLNSIEIPNSITSIGDKAFAGCDLNSITIPSSVISIGKDAFCSNLFLTSNVSFIVVDPSNPNYDSRNNCNAIIETATNTLIVGCENTIIPDDVMAIGRYAFSSCGFTSIVIPNGVKSIETGAFYNCGGLTSIVIPSSVTSIGAKAFHDCPQLTSVVLSDSVEFIGEGAFSLCSGLTSIKIPNSITSIEKETFDSCDSLTSIEIPSGVTSIARKAFSHCKNLESVNLPNTLENIETNAFLNCESLESIVVNNSSPHSVFKNGVIKTRAIHTASGCNLKKIIIPDSIKVIEGNAICYTTLLGDFLPFHLDYFHIPASVKRIGKHDWEHTTIKVLDFGGDIPETNSTFEDCEIDELRINVLKKFAKIPDDIKEALKESARKKGKGDVVFAAPELCQEESEVPGYIKATMTKNDEIVDINTKYIVSVEPDEIERYHPLTGSIITCAANGVEGMFQIRVYESCDMVLQKIERSLSRLGQ